MNQEKRESVVIKLAKELELVRDKKIEHVSEITLRKPGVKDVRGIAIGALLNMDTEAMITVTMRTASPRLTRADVMDLDISDMTQVASEILNWMMPGWVISEVQYGK